MQRIVTLNVRKLSILPLGHKREDRSRACADESCSVDSRALERFQNILSPGTAGRDDNTGSPEFRRVLRNSWLPAVPDSVRRLTAQKPVIYTEHEVRTPSGPIDDRGNSGKLRVSCIRRI